MKEWVYLSAIFGLALSSQGMAMPSRAPHTVLAEQMQKEEKPQYLYKVLSVENWNKSQSQNFLVLSTEDKDFIHLAKEDQLDRIVEKYWSHVPAYVVLKLKTNQLPGDLVYEANPGGTNKYYHLYNGSIPLRAVADLTYSHG